MADHRYCENCKFFQADNVLFSKTGNDALRFGRCGNPKAQEPPDASRFVSEKLDTPPTYRFASIFREHGPCGPDAKLFEPREPEAVAA